jgi:hypothetical protein
MSDSRLINAYKKARDMITETPDNKDNIINAYIDLVEKIDNYYNGGRSGNNYENDNKGLASMLKNPLEIEIYNNFQQYGVSSAVIPLSSPIPSSSTKSEPPPQPSLSYEDNIRRILTMSKYS